MSAVTVLPKKGNMPLASLLNLAMNFNKKVGAKWVLTFSYPFDFKILAISTIAYVFSVVRMKRFPLDFSFSKAATWMAATSLTSDITESA